MYMTQPDRQRIQHIRDYCEEIRKTIVCYSSPDAAMTRTRTGEKTIPLMVRF